MDLLGSWTYSLSLSPTWAGEPREMHQVQWVPGMRMSVVPPGRNDMVQMLQWEPNRSPGLRVLFALRASRLGEMRVFRQRRQNGGALTWGFMVRNISCLIGDKAEVVHTSYCKQKEKQKTKIIVLPLARFAQATLASSLFLKYSRPSPVLGPLRWFFPLPGMLPSLTSLSGTQKAPPYSKWNPFTP